MAVSDYEFKKMWNLNPSATVAARNAFKGISAIRIKITGIKGGRGTRAQSKIIYNLYLSVDKIRGKTIPTAWVEWPQESAITHVNIWPPKTCPKLGREYPYICWGPNIGLWKIKPQSERTLIVLCDTLHYVLMNQDFESPARRV